jgi:heme/copper-type cytochrome/quinol oxidase subunit 3
VRVCACVRSDEMNMKVLTLSQLMLHICSVSKTFGEWYQKTNKTEDTNKLTLFAFKIIAIFHTTRLAKFIKLLETVSKGLFRNRSQNV